MSKYNKIADALNEELGWDLFTADSVQMVAEKVVERKTVFSEGDRVNVSFGVLVGSDTDGNCLCTSGITDGIIDKEYLEEIVLYGGKVEIVG